MHVLFYRLFISVLPLEGRAGDLVIKRGGLEI